ncbi:MAG: hypothetical protein ACOXZK_05320 [Bacteroidales bacterium]
MTFKKENYTTTLEKAKLLVPGFREAYARMNELRMLKITDVDLQRKQVHIRQGKQVEKSCTNAPPKHINDKRKTHKIK